ncbi:unnamed protein product [Prorocentrum cordatum]|uniref:Yos1-like protein n=1 Tax=Prorocentrum cordatum TaxID=2364126 RepID=A0ABN9W4K1_9DINO|nr:unnamed protein product [Polarella glacialis]
MLLLRSPSVSDDARGSVCPISSDGVRFLNPCVRSTTSACRTRHRAPWGHQGLVAMAIRLVHLFEAGLLMMNAFAILNEKRFLRRFGLDQAVAGDNLGPKNQVATFLHAMRTFMRYPLVAMNLLIVFYELLLG